MAERMIRLIERTRKAGDTVGGVVERRWLNSAGYDPETAADEGRIQSAVRAAPFLISVQN